MKRNRIKKIQSLLSISVLVYLSFALTSCQGDSDVYEPNADVISDLESGILNGTLSQDYTLNSNIQYRLEGSFVVPEGVTFTIPAGTKIEAHKGGSNIYIVALAGSTLNINGTAANPVVMSTLDGLAGGWGGISIFGNAPVQGERSILENFYGGTIEDDNSGSISYLNIIGSGNKFSIDETFNGLALYGVGSGTTINNIAIINGKDDGIEFYGGTVSVTNLYLQNNADDAIDWTEGWKGSITNAYVTNNDVFSTAVEGDFVQLDEDSPEGFENPTITNLTVVSTENDTSTVETALQFNNESGASISGLYIEGFDIDLDMKDNGALSNVSIDGVLADVTLVSSATRTVVVEDESTSVDGDTTTIIEETNEYYYKFNSGNNSSPVDISEWTWIRRSL